METQRDALAGVAGDLLSCRNGRVDLFRPVASGIAPDPAFTESVIATCDSADVAIGSAHRPCDGSEPLATDMSAAPRASPREPQHHVRGPGHRLGVRDRAIRPLDYRRDRRRGGRTRRRRLRRGRRRASGRRRRRRPGTTGRRDRRRRPTVSGSPCRWAPPGTFSSTPGRPASLPAASNRSRRATRPVPVSRWIAVPSSSEPPAASERTSGLKAATRHVAPSGQAEPVAFASDRRGKEHRASTLTKRARDARDRP